MGLYGGHKIPLSHFGDNVTSAINNGTLEMTRLDDMITRIMTPYYFLRQDRDFPSIDPSGGYIYKYVEDGWQSGWNLSAPSNRDVRADHHIAIRKLGAAGAVLLKNVNNALPLKKLKTLGVFGNAAGKMSNYRSTRSVKLTPHSRRHSRIHKRTLFRERCPRCWRRFRIRHIYLSRHSSRRAQTTEPDGLYPIRSQ